MAAESSTNTSTEKSVKKASKSNAKWYQSTFVLGILGIGLALVIVSIIYSSVRVYMGTEDMTSRVMIAPQALFVGLALLYAFYATVSKLLKN